METVDKQVDSEEEIMAYVKHMIQEIFFPNITFTSKKYRIRQLEWHGSHVKMTAFRNRKKQWSILFREYN